MALKPCSATWAYVVMANSQLSSILPDYRTCLSKFIRAERSFLQYPLPPHSPFRVNLIDDRHAGRQVQVQHLLAAELIEVHDNRAQAVAVGRDEYVFSRLHRRKNLRREIRQGAGRGVFQAFPARRRDVVTAPPDVYLLVAEAFSGLSFVE